MESSIKEYGNISLEGLEFANFLIDTLLDKQADDIALLDVRQQAVFADYFLISSAGNERQIKALVQSVDEESKRDAGRLRKAIEGTPEGGWILIDFGDVIVHLFAPEQRTYYALEELWKDARLIVRMH
ncbi:MAG: ribosome silencing factor [Anaerolineae bacterium]|nr:ribosome silencing factor [Anaerolineae bacterium]MCO5187796.1 ribosome silencing factor [Anaerolineae bacterium]MCO5191893.1 ribosome silencing factor [Anaerolineae bacterium]MCO5197711.1 ribosome silencing factor [Anaerolineae bacterium]MCO5206636.1 ribosome silencing factor [Anaerolineae bacterium]